MLVYKRLLLFCSFFVLFSFLFCCYKKRGSVKSKRWCQDNVQRNLWFTASSVIFSFHFKACNIVLKFLGKFSIRIPFSWVICVLPKTSLLYFSDDFMFFFFFFSFHSIFLSRWWWFLLLFNFFFILLSSFWWATLGLYELLLIFFLLLWFN